MKMKAERENESKLKIEKPVTVTSNVIMLSLTRFIKDGY